MKRRSGPGRHGRFRFGWGSLTVTTVAVLFMLAGPSEAHQGNSDFRSVIDSITPAPLADGLEVEVVNYDDHVVLQNRSGEDVDIAGYRGESFARILADGTVEVNLNSPSLYENQDRYANVELPSRADEDAEPEWKVVGHDGRYEWHDHRSHYMAEGIPPEVKDESEKTDLGPYEIPIRVDGKPAVIHGTLYWHGRETGFPVLPFILLGVVAGAGGAVILARRRRTST